MPLVLCIDDDRSSLAMRKLVLEAHGYDVLTATGGHMGIKLARNTDCDAVVLDFQMPVMNGEQVARVLRKDRPSLPIILLTGSTAEIPPTLLALVDAYVPKGSGNLLASVDDVLHAQVAKRPSRSTSWDQYRMPPGRERQAK